MYVCVCNSVTDRQIRKAFAEGQDSFAKQRDTLGVATGCGACEDCARELLRQLAAEASAQESHCSALVPAAA